jgi:hypothetical protein
LINSHRRRLGIFRGPPPFFIYITTKALFTLIIGTNLILNSFTGESNAITHASAEPLDTRIYHVRTETFVQNLKRLATPAKTNETNQELLLRFLKENKIELQKSEAVQLVEKKGIVVARLTSPDQSKLEDLVWKIINTP